MQSHGRIAVLWNFYEGTDVSAVTILTLPLIADCVT